MHFILMTKTIEKAAEKHRVFGGNRLRFKGSFMPQSSFMEKPWRHLMESVL